MSIRISIIMPYHGDISVNRYMATRGNIHYTRETAKIWGMVLKGAVNSALMMGYDPTKVNTEKPFNLDIKVNFPRKFSARSGDAGNFDKFIRDIVADALGVDDAGSTGKHEASYGNGDNASIHIYLTVNSKKMAYDSLVRLV